MSTFTPTAEQNKITDAAAEGKNLVVVAVAGSGKTSTLRLIGEAVAPSRALYLAFGKDIQSDAEASFPSNVTCKTAHAVALAWFRRNMSDVARKLDGPAPEPWEAPKTLGIPGAFQRRGIAVQIGERTISSRAAASLAVATVTKFCHTTDEQIGFRHVPNEFGYGTPEQADFEAFIVPFARKAWADFTSPTGALPFTYKKNAPDVYLKLWSMACPQLTAFQTILFDEAQDADPPIAHVIRNQQRQIIMVGDPAQAIYGWRGAVDAMTDFAKIPGVETLTLTQSFRFGEAIAQEANRFLALLDSAVEVIGNPAKDSAVGTLIDADAILCRTNAACIEYAMDAQARGRKVAIAGGTKDLMAFAASAQKLINGKGMPMHPELAAFDNWGDVRAFASDEGDGNLKRMVRLIDNYGTAAIIAVCEQSENVTEDEADVIISTAHKSKGREWDSVRIASDFIRSGDDGEVKDPSPTELMLMYVAVTRAKLNLDADALAAFVAA